MPSRSQRFGAKIGGWRGSSPVAVTTTFTHADITATPYLACWTSPEGTKTQFMVLALSEEDAKTCAQLRAAQDTTGYTLDLSPMHRASEDTYRAILEVEGAEEWALRNRQAPISTVEQAIEGHGLKP